jgi:hypothetical protein
MLMMVDNTHNNTATQTTGEDADNDNACGADDKVTGQPDVMQMTDNDTDDGRQRRWQHHHPDDRQLCRQRQHAVMQTRR